MSELLVVNEWINKYVRVLVNKGWVAENVGINPALEFERCIFFFLLFLLLDIITYSLK